MAALKVLLGGNPDIRTAGLMTGHGQSSTRMDISPTLMKGLTGMRLLLR
jgi:hypothetical protein